MGKNLKIYNHNSGFTLIEIMVSSSIFMIIMLLAMGALITTSDVAKKSLALRTSMDNVNFAMETMTRSIRTGTDYTCVKSGSSVVLPANVNNDCPLGGEGGGALIFTPAKHVTPRDTAYRLVARENNPEKKVIQSCDISSCVDLVSSDIDIEKLTFFVNGSDANDLVQPSVYILMKGTITIKDESTSFAIQTMTSQRSAE